MIADNRNNSAFTTSACALLAGIIFFLSEGAVTLDFLVRKCLVKHSFLHISQNSFQQDGVVWLAMDINTFVWHKNENKPGNLASS